MPCGAKDSSTQVVCIRLEPCRVGLTHLAPIGRHWMNWFDATNKPRSPEEQRLRELEAQQLKPAEKYLSKKKRPKEKVEPKPETPKLGLFD